MANLRDRLRNSWNTEKEPQRDTRARTRSTKKRAEARTATQETDNEEHEKSRHKKKNSAMEARGYRCVSVCCARALWVVALKRLDYPLTFFLLCRFAFVVVPAQICESCATVYGLFSSSLLLVRCRTLHLLNQRERITGKL